MNAATASRRLDDLAQALDRLEEALAVPETAALAIDGTIRRFEFVFELCWKAMKALVELHTPSVNANSARAAIKAAYAAGWINDEAAWLDLLDMRKASSHTYREAMAKDIYRRITAHTDDPRGTNRNEEASAVTTRKCSYGPNLTEVMQFTCFHRFLK